MVPMRPRVMFRRMRPDAIVPRYMTAHAAGLDLCAAIDTPVAMAPGERVAISVGSLHAAPMNTMPTGSSCAKPAGTVIDG
jgi:dUTP pyrophosphatase